MEKIKILVTGSGGFIGGNIIRQAIHSENSYYLSSIDRVRESHIISTIYKNKDHSFNIADINDIHTLKIIFTKEKPHVVIHAAVEPENSPMFLQSNILGTQNIIKTCLEFNSKLLYLSTDHIYGSLKTEQEPTWTENSPINPQTPFATSKTAAELLIKTTKGLKYTIARLSNNYGPWQTSDKLIPKIIKNIAIKNIPTTIYGQGTHIRDWTHVHDTCYALFKIIDNWKDNEIYNISANQEFMNMEIFQIICNVLTKGHELISYNTNERKNEDIRHAMNSTKIKQLGWTPEYKFKDGIQQAVQWHLLNKFALGI